jgi:hypothetical protein
MSTVKAVIGYGIGLAVIAIVLAYVIRGLLRVRRDSVLKLAHRDSRRLKLSISADYARSFLGTSVQPADFRDSDRGKEHSTGSDDGAAEQGPHLRLLDHPVSKD